MTGVELIEIQQVGVPLVPTAAFEINGELRDPSGHQLVIQRGEARHPCPD
ncbi:MAG: hypothetical protein M3O29_04290 [Actinomycetota bacterium]|nr:hypothetical protein [Actinomycetota bacterium]